MQFLMPSEEETRIVLNFADGQPTLTIDAIEVDEILGEIHSKALPEDISLEERFIEIFKKKHRRKLSKAGVTLLCTIKRDMLEKVKKNLFQQDAQSGSSDSEANSQNETSDSSPTSNDHSEQ